MSLFPDNELPANSESTPFADAPLAARMRPRNLDEYVGQAHLVGPGAPWRAMLAADRLPSSLFFGPAGTGKTTLARLCADLTAAHFENFSAVTGGVADVRRIIGDAKKRLQRNASARTILFVDEIHRFNRAQQDAFLPHVEDGTIILLGATTENPLATVNTPLLSRCRLFRFEPLEEEDIIALLRRALADERGLKEYSLQVEDAALEHIARCALGDARTALNALEAAADLAVATDLARESGVLSLSLAEQTVSRRALDYDKTGDQHYDIISAYIKSLRGGDPDAALYWMARMLAGGEDPMFIARRLVIQSSEDVGNADPRALQVALSALLAVEKIGLPEAAIPLAQATVYVATAPKSNASYVALHRATDAVSTLPPARVPQHLRSTALRGARETFGAGKGYLYPHDAPGHFVAQDYLPPNFQKQAYYEPSDQGYETQIARRLNAWWGGGETETPAARSSDRADHRQEAMMNINTRNDEDSGAQVVTASGELELHTAPLLREELHRICGSDSPCCVVDLSEVSFIDSTGVGVLVGALKRSRENGGAFAIVCPQPRVRRVFEITGLLSALPIYESLTAATGACRTSAGDHR